MEAQAAQTTASLVGLDVIILAGGRGSRLGGADKSALVYRGASLRHHLLAAVRAARRVVWVGASAPESDGDAWPGLLVTREEPAFSGPAAALGAGLAALGSEGADYILLLAADLPRTADAVPALLSHFERTGGGVIAVDDSGRRQFLLGIYPSEILRSRSRRFANDGNLDGLPLRRILDAIDVAEVALGDALCADIDTVDDAVRHGIRVPTSPERSETR